MAPLTADQEPTFQEINACQRALYELMESYDTKDWDRLSACAAPVLKVDYRSLNSIFNPTMSRQDFVNFIADPNLLGNPLIKTQHFIGLSTYKKFSEDEIEGHHQMRVPHQRYTDSRFKEVAVKGHGHGSGTFWYRKIQGEWKFAGICPEVRWTEYEFEKVFQKDEATA